MADPTTMFPFFDAAVVGGTAVAITLIVVLFLALYIYTAFAWMTIAKKLNYKKPWLAWIPIANLFLLAILAKKKWPWGFIFIVPVVNIIFFIMWTWKIYEQRKYPGWLALVPVLVFIPMINWIISLANLVILGLVAWMDR